MLSAVVMVIIPGVMLVIVASLIISALREHQRQMSSVVTRTPLPSHPLDRYVKMVLHIHGGVVVSVEKPALPPVFTLPPSWYRRRRTRISLGFLLMLLLMLFVQGGLVGGTLQGLGLSLLDYSQNAIQTFGHAYGQYNASQRLARINQIDPGQYGTTDEFNTWAYSACSTAAMTEVFNSYGAHLRITDVLRVEAQIGEVSPQLGLLNKDGIERTATQFGFNTNWGSAWTLDQVIDIGNHGKPVIVDFSPDRYAGGHLLVVTGGDASSVYLADSSLWNRRVLSREQFLQWWGGFGAVVTPR